MSRLERKAGSFFLRPIIEQENYYRRDYGKRVNKAICVSQALREYALDVLNIKNCTVIPNGSDPEFFSPTRDEGDLFQGYRDYFKVIYAASGFPWQGFGLINSLANMANKKGDKILFIALDNLPKKFDFLRAYKNLLVFRCVDYSEIPKYLAQADACLCLYEDFSWLPYGFYMSPLKLFDAMASATPLIATRAGQLAAVIEDGHDGLLVDNNLEDIYNKILFLCSNGQAAEDMGKRARSKVIQYYNWQRVARETMDIFQSLLPERIRACNRA
jgi:glycosyltransferase involved in cell wall biosynthesis